MKNIERLVVISMLAILPILFLFNGIVFGHSSGEDEIEEYLDPRRQGRLKKIRPSVAPANNQVYIANCSECHFAYSPNFLPERSWRKLMRVEELEDHFGDYVAVDEGDREEILTYLIENSAERTRSRLIRKVLKSIKSSQAPIRISTLEEIEEEHEHIPEKYFTENTKVLSRANCTACHQQAEKGVFDEDDVFIPYEKLVRSN